MVSVAAGSPGERTHCNTQADSFEDLAALLSLEKELDKVRYDPCAAFANATKTTSPLKPPGLESVLSALERNPPPVVNSLQQTKMVRKLALFLKSRRCLVAFVFALYLKQSVCSQR